MDLTNNPDAGTGYTPQEAADHIATLLDSDGITETVDADNGLEADTVDETEEAEFDIDADHVDDDEAEAEVSDEEAEDDEAENGLSDETTVDVNGNNVSLKELNDGYMRQADFTRKTQELAEQRKKYELQQYDGSQIRGELSQALDGMMHQLAAVFPTLKEPDWAYLAENDPAEYVREKETWSKREAAVKQLFDAQQEVARKNAEHEKWKTQEAYKKAHEDLKSALPEKFSDKATSVATLNEIDGYLRSAGFSAEEIQAVADAKIIITAYKAMMYDQIQNKVPAAVKKIEKKPALTMPGPARQRSGSDEDAYKRDFNKLKNTGSINDAVSVISRLL